MNEQLQSELTRLLRHINAMIDAPNEERAGSQATNPTMQMSFAQAAEFNRRMIQGSHDASDGCSCSRLQGRQSAAGRFR